MKGEKLGERLDLPRPVLLFIEYNFMKRILNKILSFRGEYLMGKIEKYLRGGQIGVKKRSREKPPLVLKE